MQTHRAHGCFCGEPKGDGGRQMSSGTEKQKWGGGGGRGWWCQASSLKIYHPFTFSQTRTRSHSLNTR